MIEATRLKNGTTFVSDGTPFQVVKYTHTKVARGGATVKLRVRNLETGEQENKTFSSKAKLSEINTTKKSMQFLYADQTKGVFMDPSSFEQVEIPKKVIDSSINFIKEGEKVNILFWDERPLSIEIAPKVTLEVVDTAPGVKGNSATNIYKPAVLENGLKIKVPLFIKKGDKIRIDTRSAEYVERA